MKLRFSITIFLLYICSSSFGQSVLDKGNYQLSGAVTFTTGKTNKPTYKESFTYVYLAPMCSYFVINDLAIGAMVSFGYSEYKETEPEPYLDIFRTLSLGPVVKYYFRMDKLVPFVSAAAYYIKDLGQDRFGSNLSFSTGVDFFVARSLALEPFIEYNVMNFSKPASDKHELLLGLRLNYFIIN